MELQCSRRWKWNVSYQYEQADCGGEGMMISNLMPFVKRQRMYEVCQGGCCGQWCQRQSSCFPSGSYCWNKGPKKTKVHNKNPLSLIHFTSLSSQKLSTRLNWVFTSTGCPATLWLAGRSPTGPLRMHNVRKRGPRVVGGCLSPSHSLSFTSTSLRLVRFAYMTYAHGWRNGERSWPN